MNRVLVTGASSGLGKEVAKELILQGYRVFGLDLAANSDEPIFKSKLFSHFSFDLGDTENIIRSNEFNDFCKKIEVDTLFLIAGIATKSSFKDLNIKSVKNQFDVNLVGKLVLFKKFLEIGKIRKVIFVSSSSAFFPVRKLESYSSSHTGLVTAVKAIQYEFDVKELILGLIIPAAMRTNFHQRSGIKPPHRLLSSDPVKVAKKLLKKSTSAKNHFILMFGVGSYVSLLLSFIPYNISNKVINRTIENLH